MQVCADGVFLVYEFGFMLVNGLTGFGTGWYRF